MDLSYGERYERLRAEVRDFLAKEWAKGADKAIFREAAIARGYLYRSVPRRYGGSEQPADSLAAQVIREEFVRTKAPTEVRGIGTQMVVPTLLEHGTEAQKARFIPPTIRGEIFWCQGYSEPSAGSDLASLRTRAVLRGDKWIINGQKIWTSYARDCQFMFALVRTEPDASKHEGISYLLIDLNQPGIAIRPLKQMNGGNDFNEVFFDDAETPADMLVGARGKGWSVSKSLLKHERNMLGGVDRSEALFVSLLKLAQRARIGDRPAIEDRATRERLGRLRSQLEVQRMSANIQLSRDLEGKAQGLLPLTNKLAQSDFSQAVAEVAMELLGDDALLAPGMRTPQGNERWLNHYMASLSAAIAGGTSNIQRNIIAERGLGLPRDRAANA